MCSKVHTFAHIRVECFGYFLSLWQKITPACPIATNPHATTEKSVSVRGGAIPGRGIRVEIVALAHAAPLKPALQPHDTPHECGDRIDECVAQTLCADVRRSRRWHLRIELDDEVEHGRRGREGEANCIVHLAISRDRDQLGVLVAVPKCKTGPDT